jgi:multiple sugar transport system ATP-binding protein
VPPVAGVRFEHVTKRFGDVVAVDDLDLAVEDREFMVLLGPSGCGKTTTLRMIAGLDVPSAGTIHIGDARVDHVDPKDRDIAMVFQSYALYPHKSVRQNIEFQEEADAAIATYNDSVGADTASGAGLASLRSRGCGSGRGTSTR